MQCYDGMIIGEHSRGEDLEVNPVRAKQLTNMRTSGTDEKVRLAPPRAMALEEAIGYVAQDELIEVRNRDGTERGRRQAGQPSWGDASIRNSTRFVSGTAPVLGL